MYWDNKKEGEVLCLEIEGHAVRIHTRGVGRVMIGIEADAECRITKKKLKDVPPLDFTCPVQDHT